MQIHALKILEVCHSEGKLVVFYLLVLMHLGTVMVINLKPKTNKSIAFQLTCCLLPLVYGYLHAQITAQRVRARENALYDQKFVNT